MKRILLIVALLAAVPAQARKWEGLADTPPMGWNSWNKFACDINEELIRQTADIIVERGLDEAGYVYVNLDDCWHGGRDSLGFIQCDPERFPSGMKALSDYIHSRGLKMGIYSDAGRKTCGGRPGSFGHEYQDALTYASWGVDYLKYDWCETENINPIGAYILMRDALREAGRPVFFSMCEWGDNKPWEWAKDVGHMWRTTGDICAKFAEDTHFDTWTSWGVLSILDKQDGLRKYAGKGHWNDPDMLEVGNGMSVNQDRAHFTMWCMLAAPLILGNDLVNMIDDTYNIITNRDVIAIDQDTLGVQGLRLRREGDLELWFKPLAGGDWAFCVLNRSAEPAPYKIDWLTMCFTDEEVSGLSTGFDKVTYKIRNLWSGKEEGTTKKHKEVVVDGHDVVLYRLTPVRK